jgi:hypothetical protein
MMPECPDHSAVVKWAEQFYERSRQLKHLRESKPRCFETIQEEMRWVFKELEASSKVQEAKLHLFEACEGL